jgi:GTPase SAR1 family protein
MLQKKICMLGGFGVGKTSLVSRFVTSIFSDTYLTTIGVKIATLRTLMTYSRPIDATPSLPQKVSTQVRGTAFLFESLDDDMTVTYSDYVKVGK